jgi:membrane protein implicated in regulation of membrane protease activity
VAAIAPFAYGRAYLTRDIQPGCLGRLRYQGTEWNACAIEDMYIPKGTYVIPVQRQGNTWLVQLADC